MKKLILIASIFATTLFADQMVMHKSMTKMEDGMTFIQKGYLYNNIELVTQGLNDIESGNKLFTESAMKNYLPENKKHMANIARNQSINIQSAIDAMRKLVDEKQYIKAYEKTTDIMRSCTACHALVRNW